jgi:hypothetical protein
MVDEDPNMRIVPLGNTYEQDYGIAINLHATRFVQYVNGVLAQLRDAGWLSDEYANKLGRLYDNAHLPRPIVPDPLSPRRLP